MAVRDERNRLRRLVFVCTGNTCRSPMAEGLFRLRLADDSGWEVLSAGLHAQVGARPSSEAVAAAAELGADISGHRVRSMTDALAFSATLLVGMTASHAAALRTRFPFAAGKVRVLGEYGPAPVRDIADPFGGTLSDYRVCVRDLCARFDGLLDALRI